MTDTTTQKQPETLLMVATEASADIHGAEVVAALKAARPSVSLTGIGGRAMRAEGFDAVVHAERMAVAGLTEVLLFLPRLWLCMRRIKKLARDRRFQAAILIDAPDFNLRLARYLKRLGIPVIYYISPQLWAWRPGRVRQIRALVDRMLVILPFEKAFYDQHGVAAEFVGHPLVEQLPTAPNREQARQSLGLDPCHTPVVALLPGSRRVEVVRHLPAMLQSIRELLHVFPHIHPVIPVASTIDPDLVHRMTSAAGVHATLVEGRSTEVLSAADAAVVCSGTATLQTALLARPMVVVYRVSWLSYQILKRLVTVAHIALVNLVAGRRLVKELVQHDLTPRNIAEELRRILSPGDERTRLEEELRALRAKLGAGDTAHQVASRVLEFLPPADKHAGPGRDGVEDTPMTHPQEGLCP